MQPRDKLILEFWDRRNELTVKNKEYADFARKFFHFLLNGDIKGGDITTNSLIKKGKKISAAIVAKEEGIIAGLEEFSLINNDLKLKFLKKDGEKIKSGDILAEIKGAANKIKINVHTARPGIVIGKKGAGVESLKSDVQGLSKNEIFLNIIGLLFFRSL